LKRRHALRAWLGVIINTENGPTNHKIKKALDKSYKLLDIMEFIQVTKFELNMVMFNYFWQVMIGNTRTYDMVPKGRHGVASDDRKVSKL
jgi:hypothetical protein